MALMAKSNRRKSLKMRLFPIPSNLCFLKLREYIQANVWGINEYGTDVWLFLSLTLILYNDVRMTDFSIKEWYIPEEERRARLPQNLGRSLCSVRSHCGSWAQAEVILAQRPLQQRLTKHVFPSSFKFCYTGFHKGIFIQVAKELGTNSLVYPSVILFHSLHPMCLLCFEISLLLTCIYKYMILCIYKNVRPKNDRAMHISLFEILILLIWLSQSNHFYFFIENIFFQYVIF